MEKYDPRVDEAAYRADLAALPSSAGFVDRHNVLMKHYSWCYTDEQRRDLRTEAEVNDLPESQALVSAHRDLIEVTDVQHPSPGQVREAREELKRARIARDAALRRYWNLDMDAAPVIA